MNATTTMPGTFRAEEGAAKQEPGFHDGIKEQLQRDVQSFFGDLNNRRKSIAGTFAGLGKTISTLINADTIKGSDAADSLFGPESFVGRTMKGVGLLGFDALLGLPIRAAVHAKVNGIPVVKHAISAADNLTGRVPGRLIRKIPAVGPLLGKANNLIQGEALTYNRMSEYNTWEQTRAGKLEVKADAIKKEIDSLRAKYASAVTPEQKKAAIAAADEVINPHLYPENKATIGGRILRTSRLTPTARLSAGIYAYIRTGNERHIRGLNRMAEHLDDIQTVRKSLGTLDGPKREVDGTEMRPRDAKSYQFIKATGEKFDQLVTEIKSDTAKISQLKERFETVNADPGSTEDDKELAKSDLKAQIKSTDKKRFEAQRLNRQLRMHDKMFMNRVDI